VISVQRFRFATAYLLCAALVTGCGARRFATTPAANAKSQVASEGMPGSASARALAESSPSSESSSDGAPPRRPLSPTVETSDSRLAAALLRATAVPSAAAHRDVALEYRRLGVFDRAHDYFERAIALDPADAVSHEGVARIWRDWGTPQFGLPPAYRAVYFAPRSAAAANTLGSVLQALGRLPEAEGWYVRALALAPDAWYALNNICYVQIMRRQPSAIESCRRAVAAAGPDVTMPKNNLALAHAAAGDMPSARQWFRRASDHPATAHYNYGITLMATREYTAAAAAFADSLNADPTSTLAAARARQARLAAAQSQELPQ
jgi:tetratricopeptide (TPR) repeat protein